MKKFNRSINGYNVYEVNSFVDDTIRRVESIINEKELLRRDNIAKIDKINELNRQIEYYKNNQNEMNSSIIAAQNNAEYIKRLANSERDAIISEARKNANRIISDALLRAEKTEYEAQTLKKNVNLYKSRVRTMLNQQLDIIDDMDKDILN